MVFSKTLAMLALAIFIITVAVSVYSIQTNQQLEFMGGMAEEYFRLGVNLAQTGEFLPGEDVPTVFRPPAYPLFIAAVVKMWGGLPGPQGRGILDQETTSGAVRAVALAQGVLLALSASVLFLWMAGRLRKGVAFSLSLAYGCNPYSVILVGLLHYDVLHLFFTVVAGCVLGWAVERERMSIGAMLGAGVLWGIATLVRPMTLILPLFVMVLLLFLHRKMGRKPVIKAGLAFMVGMMLTIAPYTIRNYLQVGSIIPVNAQGGVAFWAATSKKLDRDPDHYRWWDVWYPEGARIAAAVVGEPVNDTTTYMKHIVVLESAYKKEAWKNLGLRPGIYLHNVLTTCLTFNIDINSVFIRIFQAIQEPSMQMDKRWVSMEGPQDFYPPGAANAFLLFVRVLTLCAIPGVYLAFRKRDPFILVPFCIYLCFCLAHAITYMDLMYYYIKMPFLFLFTGYFLQEIMKNLAVRLPLMNRCISSADVVAGFLLAFAAGLSAVVL